MTIVMLVNLDEDSSFSTDVTVNIFYIDRVNQL